MVEDRVAVVTGAAGGIGRASLEAFAVAGYAVAALDLDEAGARRAAEETATETGRRAVAIGCDIADWGSVENAFAHVAEALGRVDALHANVGSEGYFTFEEMAIAELRRQIDVNLVGHLYCINAALPLLERAGGGSIVITASVQGHLTFPGCVPYAAAKAGLMAVARALGRARAERHPRQHDQPRHDRHPDARPQPRGNERRGGRQAARRDPWGERPRTRRRPP